MSLIVQDLTNGQAAFGNLAIFARWMSLGLRIRRRVGLAKRSIDSLFLADLPRAAQRPWFWMETQNINVILFSICKCMTI
jgi:hypothetical protein